MRGNIKIVYFVSLSNMGCNITPLTKVYVTLENVICGDNGIFFCWGGGTVIDRDMPPAPNPLTPPRDLCPWLDKILVCCVVFEVLELTERYCQNCSQIVSNWAQHVSLGTSEILMCVALFKIDQLKWGSVVCQ